MNAALAELPLAVFTTLAPIGAGAYLTLFIAFFKSDYSDDQLKAIDKWTLLPLALVVVGLCASVLHVANPAHGFGIFAGIGSSPLSNEVFVGVVFVAVALVYTIVGLAGKLGGARKGFAAVVAILGLVFACFTGLAYMVPTVSSWDTPFLPFEMIGFALVGGSAIGACVLAVADGVADAAKKPLVVLAGTGALLAIVCEVVRLAVVSGLGTALVSGSAVVGGVLPACSIGLVLIALACLLVVLALRGTASRKGLLACGAIAVIVGVFLVRLAFYGSFLSVGLALL